MLTARSSRARAGTCSARWTPSPTRSPRTGASSSAACGTSRACTPRVYGNSPGCAEIQVLRQVRARVQRLDLDARVREAARIIGADDRRHGQVRRRVLVLDGHARRLRGYAVSLGRDAPFAGRCRSRPARSVRRPGARRRHLHDLDVPRARRQAGADDGLDGRRSGADHQARRVRGRRCADGRAGDRQSGRSGRRRRGRSPPRRHADRRLHAVRRTSATVSGSGWNWSLFRDSTSRSPETYVERCWSASGCSGLGDGTVSAASTVAETGIDIGALVAFVGLQPRRLPRGQRAAADVDPARGLHAARPGRSGAASGTPSGDLLDTTQPLTGVRSASFSASDQGGGVYQAILEVDGAPVASAIIDDNGGHCVPPFTGAVPCKPSASGTLSLRHGGAARRLALVPAGDHRRRPGPTARAYGPVQVRTQNQIAECDPAVDVRRDAGARGVQGHAREHVTRRVGRGDGDRQIAGAGPGVVVNLLSKERRSGAPRGGQRRPRSPARTARSRSRCRPGRRGGCARRGASTPSDRYFICSKALDVRVPARVDVDGHAAIAARRLARAGFPAGCSAGAVPARGQADRPAGARARALADVRHGPHAGVGRVHDALPVPQQPRRARRTRCACGCGRTPPTRSRSATRGRCGSACDERAARPAAGRCAGRAGRRAAGAGGRGGAGGARGAAGGAAGRGGRRGRPGRAGAGVGA